ncbi:TniQ family protein [Ralstonia nicotianae]|uniref:TniQ family protein n=2 Tax=Ralstonia pseudosolanacearum TaxID=1310165 RepID=UPI00399D7950
MQSFGNVLPSLEAVLEHHTRLRLLTKFATPEGAERIREHHIGDPVHGIAPIAGMAAHGARGRLSMCPECFAEDMDVRGYPTWRRLHLMPGIFACHIHQRLLLTFCDACEAGYRRCRSMWWPTLRCVCRGSMKPVAELGEQDVGVAIAVARMAAEVLADRPETCVAPEVLRRALISLTAKEHPSPRPSHVLGELLRDCVGESWVKRFALGEQALSRFTNSKLPHVRSPLQNLLVIHSVFGGWLQLAQAAVELAAASSNVTADVSRRTPQHVARSRDRSLKGERYAQHVSDLPEWKVVTLNQRHREWLKQMKSVHPGLTRKRACRLPGGKAAIRHLSVVDTAWYDTELPPVSFRRGTKANQERRTQDAAITLAKHIRRRRDLALEVRPFQRVSRAFLLDNSPTPSARRSVHTMPVVLEALAECIDSEHSLRTRVVRLVCEAVRQQCDKNPLGEPSTYEGLAARAFRIRVTRARKWLQSSIA